MTHTPRPLDAEPDNYTVQNCCICYGGNSFSGPMKEALECHLNILKTKHPVLAAAPDLLEALDPEALEAIADEIGLQHKHSARAHSLQVIAKKQRTAIAKAES